MLLQFVQTNNSLKGRFFSRRHCALVLAVGGIPREECWVSINNERGLDLLYI